MKLSEALSKLQKYKTEVGDVEIVAMTEVDNRFVVEWDREFDIVQLPDKNDDFDNAETVCAFMVPVCAECNDQRLKLVK